MGELMMRVEPKAKFKPSAEDDKGGLCLIKRY